MIAGLVSLWLLPIAVSLLLAIPLSMLSGLSLGTRQGWLGTREEFDVPPITRAALHYRAELRSILEGGAQVQAAE